MRQSSAFRSWVTADGRSGPTDQGGFAVERGRYHLYIVEHLREAKEAIDAAGNNAIVGMLDDWTDQAEERA